MSNVIQFPTGRARLTGAKRAVAYPQRAGDGVVGLLAEIDDHLEMLGLDESEAARAALSQLAHEMLAATEPG